MNSPRYAELPPAQIWARELDEGRYYCSVCTMYRILQAAGQKGERRRQATHPAKTVPELVATGPPQVFTWDITRLAGLEKGVWFHAYVIIDIYSRCAVGHTVEGVESAKRATELIWETIERNGIVPETVHADRGTSLDARLREEEQRLGEEDDDLLRQRIEAQRLILDACAATVARTREGRSLRYAVRCLLLP